MTGAALPFIHHLAHHLCDKSRQQTRAVPEWIKTRRFVLAHQRDPQRFAIAVPGL